MGYERQPSRLEMKKLSGWQRIGVVLGNPAGGPVGSRHRQQLNGEFIAALLRDFRHGGPAAIAKVRKNQPAAYCKLLTLLCPRDFRVEHSGGVKAMTDEELERSLEILKELIAKRDAAANAKVIEAVAEPVPALPPASRKARRKVRRSDRADSGLAARVVGTDSADGNS